MKMYRREQEVDGMVVDPLKACHFVKGVSAREMCHYFFMPEYRNDWESECYSFQRRRVACSQRTKNPPSLFIAQLHWKI